MWMFSFYYIISINCVYKNTDSLGMVFVILCTSSDVGAIAQKCDELSYILNERRQ